MNSKNQLTGNEILCLNNQKAQQGCFNKKCNKYAFVCKNQQCSCRKCHTSCLVMQVKSIKNTLSRQNIVSESLQNQVNQKIQKMIDYLSDFRDNIIKQIKTNFQFCSINPGAKQFIYQMNTGNTSAITGSKLWQIIHNLQEDQQILDQMNITLNQISNVSKQFSQKISLYEKQITSKIQKLNIFNQRKNKQSQKLHSQNDKSKQLRLLNKLFKKSKIIQWIQEKQIIQSFFQNQKIKETTLLYKASQNNFLTSKFHQLCDNIPNTLALVKTKYDKKIGGFTHLVWTSDQNGQYMTDQQESSFIFSVSQKDKLVLNFKEQSIYCYKDYGPTFGGGLDLCIQNKANQHSVSWANIGGSYDNQKYRLCDMDSWQRFGGNSGSSSFIVKQWQVWKIQFV